MLHVFPVAHETVLTSVPFLYKLIVAGLGLLGSKLVHVPVTAIELPVEIGELIVGAGVQSAPTPVKLVRLIAGCALTTSCHAAGVLA